MRHEQAVYGIIAGDHPDPFSFLGPHEEDGKPVVRTFLPGASAVEVVSTNGKSLGRLALSHPDGLFAGVVSESVPYRLRVNRDEESVTGESVIGESVIGESVTGESVTGESVTGESVTGESVTGESVTGESVTGVEEIEDPYRFPAITSEYDLYLFGEGNHDRLYDVLGAHPTELRGVSGVRFAVWAPNARRVSVVGDFNGWDGRRHPMRNRGGVWELFVPDLPEKSLYKYEIKGADGQLLPLKADPFGFFFEQHPGTASIVHDAGRYEWTDVEWMESREERNALDAPMSTYEVHLGSWRRKDDGSHLTYEELAGTLVPYVQDLGYTHVEFLPPTEHPFGGSWGYQPLGLFAPTSRFGEPDDFKRLVDAFHRAGIGVIMDWVPAHFPEDSHGLALFDGTHLYEHSDPRLGRHPDWGTLIFNYGRNEVKNYLTANALFWLSEYHIDGLRVDAVASMLYLDYSREDGEWLPNRHGGNENLEAIDLLKKTNELVYVKHPGAFTVAEESTAWPMVSRPTSMGGLGFGYKWNMGWMHDSLEYMQQDPVNRSYHHNEITFSLIYAFNENFVLPLSHDEVVHGKRSLIGRMPGDEWQRFANLRAYYGFMYAHPGKQLLFMGGEIAQQREWSEERELDWNLLENAPNAGVQSLVRDLNALYKKEPALYERDFESSGFEWISGGDTANSVVSFLRKDASGNSVVVVCNFTPVVRENYRVGVPKPGEYAELLNTDAAKYGGSGVANGAVRTDEEEPSHGQPTSIALTLPPLSTLVLKASGGGRES